MNTRFMMRSKAYSLFGAKKKENRQNVKAYKAYKRILIDYSKRERYIWVPAD